MLPGDAMLPGVPGLRSPIVRIVIPLAVVALLVFGVIALFSPRSQEGTFTGRNSAPGVDQPVNVPVRADADADGLTDSEETALGTNPAKVDTDADGLSDYEEAKVYGTNPKNPDTDGDGHGDGAEVDGDFNPKGEGPLLPSAEAIKNLNAQAPATNTNA